MSGGLTTLAKWGSACMRTSCQIVQVLAPDDLTRILQSIENSLDETTRINRRNEMK